MGTQVANRTWRQKNPEKSRAASKRWAEANADRVRDRRLQRKFGITLAQYNQMLADQKNTCAICKGPPSGKGAFHVDHDHISGKVRGLLCLSCNTAIGLLRERTDLAYSLVAYLERTT